MCTSLTPNWHRRVNVECRDLNYALNYCTAFTGSISWNSPSINSWGQVLYHFFKIGLNLWEVERNLNNWGFHCGKRLARQLFVRNSNFVWLYPMFPHCVINGTTFGKKLLNVMYVSWYSRHVFETFLILRRIQRDIIIRRKFTQNSTEVDAETKESTRKTEEKLDGMYTEGHERKKPKWRPVGR